MQEAAECNMKSRFKGLRGFLGNFFLLFPLSRIFNSDWKTIIFNITNLCFVFLHFPLPPPHLISFSASHVAGTPRGTRRGSSVSN